MTDPRFFSNPMRHELLQVVRPQRRTRLGSEHVRFNLLDSRGEWVVALICGTTGKMLGPVSVRYDEAYGAGDELYRLGQDRIVAKGCYLRTMKMVDFWDQWGRRTAEFDRYGQSDPFRVR